MSKMPTEQYREYQLPLWIVPHIIEDLYMIGDLAQKVLEYKDIQTSTRTTFVPNDWDEKTIERDYLNIDTSRSITLSWLSRKVQEFVFLGDDHIVISEDPSAHPSDSWIKKKKVPIISFKNEVLYEVYGKSAESLEYIEQRIRIAEGASYLFGIMSSLPKSYLPLAATIDENIIELLAKRCESMFVSAFDGTGYIICSFDK
jgi:hypothetical protein